MKTKLEYRDLLVRTSAEGGFPSAVLDPNADTGVACLYRSADGKRCAIGLLIPDDKYDKSMENSIVSEESVLKYVEKVEGFGWNAYRECQGAHDVVARGCLSRGDPWNHEAFVERLNELCCFQNLEPVPC